MSGQLTDSVRARFAESGATPSPLDVYAGVGSQFYANLVGPDRSEVREVLRFARRTGGPVLDIAAGGGRLTIPLARSGHLVTALDLSPDMLAHLQRALSDDDRVDVVIADMRDFNLGREYRLVVIGATSITLLDAEGRRDLYAAVHRHLADGGIFALSIAGDDAVTALRETEDHVVEVRDGATSEDYLCSQQIVDDGAVRLVNWVRLADLDGVADAVVLTSRLRILDSAQLAEELLEAGFSPPVIHPVRAPGVAPGAGMLLLETTRARTERVTCSDV
ncbi:MAG: daptide-type RiPP biosynthesis methyltransferase [Microbacterium sp.]